MMLTSCADEFSFWAQFFCAKKKGCRASLLPYSVLVDHSRRNAQKKPVQPSLLRKDGTKRAASPLYVHAHMYPIKSKVCRCNQPCRQLSDRENPRERSRQSALHHKRDGERKRVALVQQTRRVGLGVRIRARCARLAGRGSDPLEACRVEALRQPQSQLREARRDGSGGGRRGAAALA